MSNIVVVGSGVVGQATGKGLAKKGHTIQFVDVNPETIKRLRSEGWNASTIKEVDWQQVDVVMVSVPTPSVDDEILLDYIDTAAHDIGAGLAQAKQFVVVVVRSTVPPLTTEKRVLPILERVSGKRAGVDFGLAMNPEFLRAVSNERDFERPWITVLGAVDHRSMEILDRIYRQFGALTVYCTPTEAEMIKYVNNIYNAVKISYFNEVALICEQLGIDSDIVSATVARSAESMWNPLYGTRGGVPYGGACLPKDTTAFLSFVRKNNWVHHMLEATIHVNRQLEEMVPAAPSADQIVEIQTAVKAQREQIPAAKLALELGLDQRVVNL